MSELAEERGSRRFVSTRKHIDPMEDCVYWELPGGAVVICSVWELRSYLPIFLPTLHLTISVGDGEGETCYLSPHTFSFLALITILVVCILCSFLNLFGVPARVLVCAVAASYTAAAVVASFTAAYSCGDHGRNTPPSRTREPLPPAAQQNHAAKQKEFLWQLGKSWGVISSLVLAVAAVAKFDSGTLVWDDLPGTPGAQASTAAHKLTHRQAIVREKRLAHKATMSSMQNQDADGTAAAALIESASAPDGQAPKAPGYADSQDRPPPAPQPKEEDQKKKAPEEPVIKDKNRLQVQITKDLPVPQLSAQLVHLPSKWTKLCKPPIKDGVHPTAKQNADAEIFRNKVAQKLVTSASAGAAGIVVGDTNCDISGEAQEHWKMWPNAADDPKWTTKKRRSFLQAQLEKGTVLDESRKDFVLWNKEEYPNFEVRLPDQIKWGDMDTTLLPSFPWMPSDHIPLEFSLDKSVGGKKILYWNVGVGAGPFNAFDWRDTDVQACAGSEADTFYDGADGQKLLPETVWKPFVSYADSLLKGRRTSLVHLVHPDVAKNTEITEWIAKPTFAKWMQLAVDNKPDCLSTWEEFNDKCFTDWRTRDPEAPDVYDIRGLVSKSQDLPGKTETIYTAYSRLLTENTWSAASKELGVAYAELKDHMQAPVTDVSNHPEEAFLPKHYFLSLYMYDVANLYFALDKSPVDGSSRRVKEVCARVVASDSGSDRAYANRDVVKYGMPGMDLHKKICEFVASGQYMQLLLVEPTNAPYAHGWSPVDPSGLFGINGYCDAGRIAPAHCQTVLPFAAWTIPPGGIPVNCLD